MRKIYVFLLVATLSAAAAGQAQSAAKSATPKKKTTAARKSAPSAAAQTQAQLQELKTLIEQQQQQINELRNQLTQSQQTAQQAQSAAQQSQSAVQQAQSRADEAATQAGTAQQATTSLQSTVNDLKANATTQALALQDEQKRVTEMVESPLAFHFKGITLTPGGFIEAATVWRQRGTASDINTPFNSIPFSGANAAHLGEFFGSGRQSRLSLLAEGKYKDNKFTAYYETDWLSAGVTSNNNESNSYTNRMRQLYGQAAIAHGWTFTGGQMWSLVTETKSGLNNRTEVLPMTIDPQYHVGFSWARQYGFRVTKTLGKKAWVGFSVEDPQILLTVHGNASNFVVGNAGTGGGLFNLNANYSFNQAPDLIFKAAFEPGFGHYEVFGLVRQFRDRIYPNATATPASGAGAFNDSTTGGGGGVNARFSVAKKKVDIGFHFLGGEGVGRYGTSTLPDVTVRPDGTLALLDAVQGLGTLELHTKRWDVYSNAGTEYVGRGAFLRGAAGEGYGSPLFSNAGCLTEVAPAGGNGFQPGTPAACNNDTRTVIEGTFGFWFKPYNGDRGRIQFGPQYSYVTRNTWTGVGGAPHAVENMFLTSFRYYLP